MHGGDLDYFCLQTSSRVTCGVVYARGSHLQGDTYRLAFSFFVKRFISRNAKQGIVSQNFGCFCEAEDIRNFVSNHLRDTKAKYLFAKKKARRVSFLENNL